jgi:hypothetical protein
VVILAEREVTMEAGSWQAIKWAIGERDVFMLLDELLHAVERLPIPAWVWEIRDWRARFCTWAVVRAQENAIKEVER